MLHTSDLQRARRLGLALAGVVGVVFLTAAAFKAWQPSPLWRSVVYLSPLPVRDAGISAAIALSVIGWEAFLGVGLLLSRPGTFARNASVWTLAAFSFVLAYLATDPKAPGCGCFGWTRTSWTPPQEAAIGIARNIALIALLWIGGQTRRIETRDAVVRESGNPQRSLSGHQGFTLLELLVVIAIVAVLLAIIAPALLGSRTQARETRGLATSRHLLIALEGYGDNHKEQYPFFGTTGDPTGPIVLHGMDIGGLFFNRHAQFWPSLVVPDYFSERSAIETPAGRQIVQQNGWPEEIIASTVWMTYTAVTAPAYWDGETEPPDRSLFRAGRRADVQFPSSKGILISIGYGFIDDSLPVEKRKNAGLVGMADGSAAMKPWDWNSPRVVDRPHDNASVPWPVLSTRGGLGGRDFD